MIMGHYWERYKEGDCEAVWRELTDLGEEALQPRLLGETTQITEEIVRRIIHNANIIGQYLKDAGYEFESPGPFVVPANNETAQDVQQIEQEYGELPLFLKVWWKHVDHLNHFPTESFRSSGQGCPLEGISPTAGILIDNPKESLEYSRQRAIDIQEHIKSAEEAGITGEDEYYEDEPHLVLGPYTSGNDHVGYQLPLNAVDAICHRTADDEEPESLVDWLRFYYLKKAGLNWQFFGSVSNPEGGTKWRSFIRPNNEVEAIVQSMNLVSF